MIEPFPFIADERANLAILAMNFSSSLFLNSRYPMAGFLRAGSFPASAQVLTVPAETPQICAALATFSYPPSLDFIIESAHAPIGWHKVYLSLSGFASTYIHSA
jgi:hypothetical protein